MSNEDSFNDSDEMFNLYSSKKVTDTFKAQLKKIAANNHHLNKTFSHVNNDSILCKKREKVTNHGKPANMEKEKVVPVVEKFGAPIILIDDEQPDTLVEVNDKSLEDNVGIIREFSQRPTRQSERLRKKRSAQRNSRDTSLDIAVHKPTQSRNRGLKQKGQQSKPVEEITLDDSHQNTETDDELNPELSVKVIWKSVNVKKFEVRKFQKLSYIFDQLSKEENIAEDKIMLTFNNIRVSRNDTPDSLNLQVYHFLDGGVLSDISNLNETLNSQNPEYNSDCVVVKFQDANKKIIKLNLNRNEKLKVGMIKCSEQLEIPLNKIRFFFDGEFLEPYETPASLGLENEEVIDIKICS